MQLPSLAHHRAGPSQLSSSSYIRFQLAAKHQQNAVRVSSSLNPTKLWSKQNHQCRCRCRDLGEILSVGGPASSTRLVALEHVLSLSLAFLKTCYPANLKTDRQPTGIYSDPCPHTRSLSHTVTHLHIFEENLTPKPPGPGSRHRE